ncbi:MAG: prepilin peptidase [Caulobacteraceae bacterium]
MSFEAFVGSAPALTAAAAVAAAPAGVLSAWIARRLAKEGLPIAAFILATVVVFVWAALLSPSTLVLAFSLILGWTLVLLAMIDVVCLRLPDLVTLPLIAVGLLVAILLPGRTLASHLLGAAVGYLFLALMGWAFLRFRRVEGMGLGDAKLLGAAGAWLGWRPLPSLVLIACALAVGGIAVRLALRRGDLRDPIPFGPPLALSIWLVWLYGPLVPYSA